MVTSTPATDVLLARPEGVYCPAGDFHIDPWRGTPRAVITHAHGDHARPGAGEYWCAAPALELMRLRVGGTAEAPAIIHPVPYGERFRLGEATVSFHPAGHVLGSAQVRVEVDGRVWVNSGDYKRDADPTCAPFEVVPCDTFITECTFGLPVYRWQEGAETAAEIFAWWQQCKAEGRTAVLFAYALGKAQRVLAHLADLTDETVLLHGAVVGLTEAYRAAGVRMPPTEPVGNPPKGTSFAGRLVLAPPGAAGSPWMRRFSPYATGFASGWMRLRGARRRKGYDRGFVLSDHADWNGLVQTALDTGAGTILCTHGNTDGLVGHLRRLGLQARAFGENIEYESEEAD